ncbi:MAG TPA: anti-sigma factor [Castellaniella sp.]|uniref:anti-sigma factor n=1 Tax=Castellaniella sp. TaxID=1955812 RepID=UPI002F140E06
MKIYADPQLRARLTADYVSGAMKGAARRRFEGLMAADASLRRQVRTWEDDLYALVWAVPPRRPPGRVWHAIHKKVHQKTPMHDGRIWSGTGFWRLCSATLAAALVAVVVIQPMRPNRAPFPQQVAVLQSSQGQALLMVREGASGALYINTLKDLSQMADGHALELWSIQGKQKPRSLGLVATDGLTQLSMPHGMGHMEKLAVSLEPPGGSPTGLPTGPVIISGGVLPS